MKKNTRNNFYFINRLFISIIALMINLTLNGCSENTQNSKMKQENEPAQQVPLPNNQIKKLLDLDIYHNAESKNFTEEGIKLIKKAISYSEDLLANIYKTKPHHIRCLSCEEKVFEGMFFSPKNEEKIILCASCATTKSQFNIENKLYSIENCELTITDSENKKLDNFDKKIYKKNNNEELEIDKSEIKRNSQSENLLNIKFIKETENNKDHPVSTNKILQDLSTDNCEDLEIEKYNSKKEHSYLVGSSAMCDVLESIYNTMSYICSFERRPIENRINTTLSIAEALEHILNPNWICPFLFSNGYTASIYKSNNLFKNDLKEVMDTNNRKIDITKLLFQESENLSLNLSLTFSNIMDNLASQQQKNLMDLLLKNPKLVDFSVRNIVAKTNAAVKNNLQKSLAPQILANTSNELALIYNRIMSEALALTDIKKEITNLTTLLTQNINAFQSPQMQQAQQLLQVFKSIEQIENAISTIKNFDINNEESGKEEKDIRNEIRNEIKEKVILVKGNQHINNPINKIKINLDEYYNHKEDGLTIKGAKFMKSIVYLAEKMTTPIYDSTGKIICSSCKEPHENRMMLSPESIPEMRICIFCIENEGDFNYKKDSYTIKNKKLYLGRVTEEKPFMRKMNETEDETENEDEKGKNRYNHLSYSLREVELNRNSNISYVAENMCSLLKRILGEYRRSVENRSENLSASEFIEICLNEKLFPYYLLYLSYASCLYFEQKLIDDLMEDHLPIQQSEIFISKVGLNALYAPTFAILYTNNYISEKKISPERISKYSTSLFTEISRYIAQMAINKEEENMQRSIGIISFGGLTSSEIKEDINYLCSTIFLDDIDETTKIEIKDLRLDEEKESSSQNFKEESIIKISKLDSNIPVYKNILQNRESNFMLEFEKNRDNENKNNSLCCKALIIAAALQIPLYYILPMIFKNM